MKGGIKNNERIGKEKENKKPDLEIFHKEEG